MSAHHVQDGNLSVGDKVRLAHGTRWGRALDLRNKTGRVLARYKDDVRQRVTVIFAGQPPFVAVYEDLFERVPEP
jgi:hypothetical protein